MDKTSSILLYLFFSINILYPQFGSVKIDFDDRLLRSDEKHDLINLKEDIRRFRLPEGEEFQEFRRLQGQAPYIVNASLNYESFEKNIEASIFYNTQGKTLEIVGNDTVTDVFTLPFNSLNTSIEKRFINQDGKIKTLRFKVDNILGDKRESMYEFFNFEPKTFSYRNYGTTYSLSYSINL